MKLFLYNFYDNGDVVLSRPLIRAVSKLKNVDILLCVPPKKMYLIEDLGEVVPGRYPCKHISMSCNHKGTPVGYISMSMWFGTFRGVLKRWGLSWHNLQLTWNKQIKLRSLPSSMKIGPQDPVVDFPDVFDYDVRPDSVFVENGPVRSKQSDIKVPVKWIVESFPELNFYFSDAPGVVADNCFDVSRLNLRQLSKVSEKCLGFLTRGSGVNTCTYTKQNKGKPRALLGWTDSYCLWPYSGDDVKHVRNKKQISRFLRGMLR